METIKMKDKCIIVGAGTYGQVYAEYLKKKYEIIGFIDDDQSLINKRVAGIPVIGNLEYLLRTISRGLSVFVPIGNTQVKRHILDQLRREGFKTPNYIDPSANIHSSVKIGKNAVYILQGTILMPLSVIEDDVMISSGCIISHHTSIKCGSFVSFGVNIGASIVVEEDAYIGIGCTIMTGVKRVGEGSLVGAGTVVIKDVPDGATVVGNPGRIIKMKSI